MKFIIFVFPKQKLRNSWFLLMNQLQTNNIQQNKNYKSYDFSSHETKIMKFMIFVNEKEKYKQQTVTEQHKFCNNIILVNTKQKIMKFMVFVNIQTTLMPVQISIKQNITHIILMKQNKNYEIHNFC